MALEKALPIEEPKAPPATAEPLIKTVGLTRHFRVGGPFSRRMLHAADDITLPVGANETAALVGGSGSGKSTVARLLARVSRPPSGDILYRGRSLSHRRSHRARLEYAGRVPMVFQDPYGSLSPGYRVSHGVMRALKLHRPELSALDRGEEAERILQSVGLTPPPHFLKKYPY